MYKIKVENNVPMPWSTSSRKEGIVKTMRNMKPGQSFIWPGKSISNVHLYAKIARVTVVSRAIRDKDGKMVLGPHGKPLHRFWRVGK